MMIDSPSMDGPVSSLVFAILTLKVVFFTTVVSSASQAGLLGVSVTSTDVTFPAESMATSAAPVTLVFECKK